MNPNVGSKSSVKKMNTSTHNLVIQHFNSNDYDDWLTLWQAYLTFYQTSLPIEISQETWRKLSDEDIPVHGFGAYQDGKLVGFVHTVLHPNTWNDTDVCYLEDLYITDSVRGIGAGRALIEYVYDFAKSKNCNRVYWTTQEDNMNARKLYDKIATRTDMVQYRYDL